MGVPFLAFCAACLRRCAPGPVSLRCVPDGGAASAGFVSTGLASAGLPSVDLASGSGFGGVGHGGGFGRAFAVLPGRTLVSLGFLCDDGFGRAVSRALGGGGGFVGRGRRGGGLLFGGFFLRWDVAYRVWSVFVIACQISLAPRPVAAENGSGSAPSWRMLRKPCSCSD